MPTWLLIALATLCGLLAAIGLFSLYFELRF